MSVRWTWGRVTAEYGEGQRVSTGVTEITEMKRGGVKLVLIPPSPVTGILRSLRLLM